MQVGEFFVYLMLTIILIALIGVLMWLVYDYGNLKNILSSNFNIISNKFSSHKTTDNTLDENIKINTSNFNDEIKNTSNYVNLIASDSSNYVNLIASDSSNYVGHTSTNIKEDVTTINNEINTFNDNLDKYFKFGKEGSGIYTWTNNSQHRKLFDYVTTSYEDDHNNKYLQLVNDTLMDGNVTMRGEVKICPTDATDDTNCLTINNELGNITINPPHNTNTINIGKLSIENNDLKWNNISIAPAAATAAGGASGAGSEAATGTGAGAGAGAGAGTGAGAAAAGTEPQ